MTQEQDGPRPAVSDLVLAIDPGPVRSAWLVFDRRTRQPHSFAIEPNDDVLDLCRRAFLVNLREVVIEKVESFGMSIGAEVFETVFWSGRFAEAADRQEARVTRIGRLRVKTTLCHDSRAKDSNIRQALIDRFGGSAAIGRKAAPGPLYGISNDVWSALAIAVTYVDQQEGPAT